MKHSWTLILALLATLSNSAQAQQTQPCTAPEYRQFDFWVGEWEVFDYSKGTKGDLAGTNRITKEFGGCVLQEHWEGKEGGKGSSFNTYYELDKKWHQVWVDSSGTFLNLAGEYKDGKMVLVGEHPGRRAGITVTERITWSLMNNDPNQVRQLWDVSRDGGKTWEVAFDGLYIRKK